MRLRWSIFTQLLTLVSLIVVGSLALGVWAAASAAERAAKGQTERQLGDVLQTMESADFPLTGLVLEQLKGLSGFEFSVVEPDGETFSTFFGSAPPVPSLFEDATASMGARRPTPRTLLGEKRRIGDRWYIASLAKAPLGKANAGRAVAVWIEERRLLEANDATRSFLLRLFLAGCAVAAVVAILISRWFAGRLQRLEAHARRIAEGDFRPSPISGPQDELSSLAKALNETAERLAAATESLRRSERLQLLGRLGGGLAHQLRNHVAGAKLALEVGGDAEAHAVALRQLKRAERDLQRFLEIGRSDAGGKSIVRPSKIVDDALELLRPRAQHLGIELVWTRSNDERTLTANADQLGHAVSNLAVNALEAAGPGGSVFVEQIDGSDVLEWRVTDTGPGPPANIAGILFEPFVSGKQHGIGLGLAVVLHAVGNHGGTVDFHRDSGRTIFVVRIPWNRLPS